MRLQDAAIVGLRALAEGLGLQHKTKGTQVVKKQMVIINEGIRRSPSEMKAARPGTADCPSKMTGGNAARGG